MPNNPLTETLKDFRKYRPAHHEAWLGYVYGRANHVGIRKYALEDQQSAVHYLGILDQIRDFRNRHWNLTKEYIIKHTKYPRATGGSPIVTWLPN
jgi:indoleamine 2,3-dioxygenase